MENTIRWIKAKDPPPEPLQYSYEEENMSKVLNMASTKLPLQQKWVFLRKYLLERLPHMREGAGIEDTRRMLGKFIVQWRNEKAGEKTIKDKLNDLFLTYTHMERNDLWKNFINIDQPGLYYNLDIMNTVRENADSAKEQIQFLDQDITLDYFLDLSVKLKHAPRTNV